jgi:hypothetical protein
MVAAVLAAAVAGWTMTLGEFPLSIPEVVRATFGIGEVAGELLHVLLPLRTLTVGSVEISQVLQVLRPSGSSLHPSKVGQRGDADVDPERLPRLRRSVELAVGVLIEPGDPLHDVESPDVGVHEEVAAHREIAGNGRVGRELTSVELLYADLTGVQSPQETRESGEVRMVRRRAHVDILRRSDHTVSDDGEAADDDVSHPCCVELAEPLGRVEGSRHRRAAAKAWAMDVAAKASLAPSSRFTPI